MEQLAWIFWIVLGVALIIAETFTFGFVLFWFGIGAIAAAVAAWLGLGFGVQFIVFAVVSVVFTAMSRTIFAKYYSHGDADLHKTGIDSLPGQVGTVKPASKGALNQAAVKAYGTTWTAFPVDSSQPLVEGEKVIIERVEGASIYVSPVMKKGELPDWRNDQ